MSVYEKLSKIQQQLKAPKGQYNDFGKYKYRSCEDILEAVKPICATQEVVLILSDEIIDVNGRNYVRSTATLVDTTQPTERIVVTASAREEEMKKGMDGSQITGASSSYARKYAMNGLFNIDDTKDSDATNKHGKDDETPSVTKADVFKAKNTTTTKGTKIGTLTEDQIELLLGSSEPLEVKQAARLYQRVLFCEVVVK